MEHSECFPLPEDGGSWTSRYSESCILWSYSCGLIQGGDSIACTIPAACRISDAPCRRRPRRHGALYGRGTSPRSNIREAMGVPGR